MKRLRLTAKQIASRLTGISCPLAGISWTPPTDERKKAERLLVFLEDCHALYRPFHAEIEVFVNRSVLEIRQRLTEDLEDLSSSSVLAESMRAMRAACRKFLDQSRDRTGPHGHFLDSDLYTALGELRAIFGIHIAKIACAYGLEVHDDLVTILPPESDTDDIFPDKDT